MTLGIYDVYGGKSIPNQEIYEKILEYNNINFIHLSINDNDFWNKVRSVDLIMFKWPNNDNMHQLSSLLRPLLELHEIKYFPNQSTSWHFDDKIKQYFLLSSIGSPVVPTNVYFSKQQAVEFANRTEYPIIAKLTKGASSSNVIMLKNRRQALRHISKAFSSKGISATYFGSHLQIIKTLNLNPRAILVFYLKKIRRLLYSIDDAYWQKHKNYVLFQEFLPGNEYDTRVTTVGQRVHAFRRFVRKNDFRASGGETWDINPEQIDSRMLRIALEISKKMNFQTMAYDFIYDRKHEPKIVEISNLYGQPGYPDFLNGYWDNNLNRVEGRFWPQHLELTDMLDMPGLKCPDIQIPREWYKNQII
jgi:glutathione synthase/RimK-type ligase-like ATP-grasp enzyme